MLSRRTFLGSVFVASGFSRVAPAGALAQRRPANEPSQIHVSHDSSFDPWIEINAANLRHNVQEIWRRVGTRPILAVIKNNGYGLGVVNVGRLVDLPFGPPAIHGVAVVKLHEAMTLRDAGFRKPIVLLGPVDERDLADAAALDIEPIVYTPIGDVLERIGRGRQKPVSIQVCIDTGIGRVGVPWRDAPALIRDLASRKSVQIVGTFMTFTEDAHFDPEQLRRFTTIVQELESQGVRLGRKHAASSFALFQGPDGFLDMVRPGMAVFGIYSEARFRTMGVMDLKPAVALRARVAYVKQLKKWDSAGYERAYVADRDAWVATLPVGHADGWPRAAAKKARVRINGALYPVVASVSASHTIVEIGNERRVEIGDTATLFDWTDGSRPEDVAAACDASVYDLTMHLNALLSRRVVS